MSETLPTQNAEPDLDLVQPASMVRREDEAEAAVPCKPSPRIGTAARVDVAGDNDDLSSRNTSATAQLEELASWLLEQGVESVAMESTHVYWIPAYELLEARGIEVLLVNARQLHNVPGRKTDMKDCQWLQMLHSCGLLCGSFRPAENICRLRAMQRQRDNLKYSLELFDILESQIAMYESQLLDEIEALQPPERKDQPVAPHPNPAKERQIRRRGEQEQRTRLWRLAGVDLTRIDGVSSATAMTVLTEVGTNLAAFPSEDDFVSWLRLSPRRPISGGKQLRKRPNGTGANRLSGVLRMAALSHSRSKTALGAYYRRIARRKEGKVAIFATAR